MSTASTAREPPWTRKDTMVSGFIAPLLLLGRARHKGPRDASPTRLGSPGRCRGRLRRPGRGGGPEGRESLAQPRHRRPHLLLQLPEAALPARHLGVERLGRPAELLPFGVVHGASLGRAT